MAKRLLAGCLAVASGLLTARADADGQAGTSPQCVAAYEQAQVDKKGGRLHSARNHLLACSGVACPIWMQKECQVWLEEVDRATPTVVLTATVEGEDRTQVQVDLDGKPWLDAVGTRAQPMEIGEHVITFRVPGYPPVEKRFVLSEGEKLKRVRAEFEHPKPKPRAPTPAPLGPTAPVEMVRPIPAGVWVLGGAALVSLGASVVLGLGANDDRTHLENTCAPACSDADVDELRNRYVMTNVALGVGIAAAAGAVAWYFARPAKLAPRQYTGQLVGPRRSAAGIIGFEF